MLASSSALQRQQAYHAGAAAGLARRAALPRPQVLPPRLHAGRRAPRAVVAARAAPASAADLADEEDDLDWTEDMPAPVRRRVRALRDVQARADDLARALARERAALEAKFEREAAPLAAERAAVVSGKRAVERYDVPDDEDGGELADDERAWG
jgi:hypothetical protein